MPSVPPVTPLFIPFVQPDVAPPFGIEEKEFGALPPDMQTALTLVQHRHPLVASLAMSTLAQKFADRAGLPAGAAAAVVDAMIAGATSNAHGFMYDYATPMLLSALLFHREDALPKIRDLLLKQPGVPTVSDDADAIVPAQVLWQGAFGALALAPDTASDIAQLLQDPVASWEQSGRILVLRALGIVAHDLRADMLSAIEFVLQPELIARAYTQSTGNAHTQPQDVRSMWDVFFALERMGTVAAPAMERILDVLDQQNIEASPNFALKVLQPARLAQFLREDPRRPGFHKRVIEELKRRDAADPERLPGSMAALPYLFSGDPQWVANACGVVDPAPLADVLVRDLATLGGANPFDPFSTEDAARVAVAVQFLPNFGLTAWRAVAAYRTAHAEVGFLDERLAPIQEALVAAVAHDIYDALQFMSGPGSGPPELQDPAIRAALLRQVEQVSWGDYSHVSRMVAAWGPDFLLAVERRASPLGKASPEWVRQQVLRGMMGSADYRGWSADPAAMMHQAQAAESAAEVLARAAVEAAHPVDHPFARGRGFMDGKGAPHK